VLAEERPTCCSAIWFVAAPVAGVLADVNGVDEARNVKGVTDVQLLVRPGSAIGPLESSDSRVAYVRAVGETADLAVNAAREAAAHLEIQLRVRAVSEQTV
jgi:L-amino acid ligase C-terminal domain 2